MLPFALLRIALIATSHGEQNLVNFVCHQADTVESTPISFQGLFVIWVEKLGSWEFPASPKREWGPTSDSDYIFKFPMMSSKSLALIWGSEFQSDSQILLNLLLTYTLIRKLFRFTWPGFLSWKYQHLNHFSHVRGQNKCKQQGLFCWELVEWLWLCLFLDSTLWRISLFVTNFALPVNFCWQRIRC